jgi:hypothetical protein
MSSKISEYFNPSQHLAIYQDKNGHMIGGGYQVNNLLYQHKMPLFVSLNDDEMMSGGGGIRDDETAHFIPEKFSDLFRDLAVPAGLFMMPAMFRAKQYSANVPKTSNEDEHHLSDKHLGNEADAEVDDSDDETTGRQPVPNDIFDTLLSMVTPSERIQHDVKTRRYKEGSKKKQIKTRRGKIE